MYRQNVSARMYQQNVSACQAMISTVMRILAALVASALLLSAQADFNSLKELK